MMSSPRRLLVVSHGFPPYYGGAEHVAGYLATAASASWRVQVLTSDIGGRLASYETPGAVEVFRVPTRKKKWAHHTIWELCLFLWATRRFRLSERPDHILAHFSIPGGMVARRLARKWKVPYSVVLHGADVPGSQKERYGIIYHVVRPWVRRIWCDAAHVIAVSENLRALALETWPHGVIKVIPNGVDTQFFQPLELSGPKTSKGWITIISAARLHWHKGLQEVISGLAEWPLEWRGRVRFCVCGIGPYEAELRRLAQEKGVADLIEWAGLLTRSELRDRLRAADIFVLPSFQEGLPLALLEAMACGLPVVATDVGGVGTVVRDGENGYLLEVGDSRRLNDALIRLARDPDLRSQMGAAAHRSAQSRSWVSVWDQYEAVLFAEGQG